MALVGYSDSEDSDAEAAPQTTAPPPTSRPKTTKEPLISSSGPRRIKVDLPAAAAPEVSKPEDRPAKRARTGGAFSDFNALLPQPKRAAENAKKNGLGAKFSLKTSSAAAFSRDHVEPTVTAEDAGPEEQEEAAVTTSSLPPVEEPKAEEVKIVGNAMRFRPLSVANNKKKPKRPVAGAVSSPQGKPAGSGSASATATPAPKPAVSLFTLSHNETPAAPQQASDKYVPMIATEDDTDTHEDAGLASMGTSAVNSKANPLSAVADDLNLSEADRRRLFGRGGRDGPVNITNFNMDEEYDRNEAFRASGEAVQHRAVRAVGSGKHSIQQLVSSAVGQRDALEDKWAEGRRNRGDAGNKYGW